MFPILNPPPSSLYAAAAKSLQSCQTLWDPIDGSPPGSPIPGILQARTLEWVAISFSNAWKWKVISEREVAQSCPTLSNPVDCSPPGSSIHGIFQARVLEWTAKETLMYKCYFLKMFILSKLFARFNVTPTKLQWDLIFFSLNLGDFYLFLNKYLLKYNTSTQLTELCFTLLRISQLFFSAPFSSQGSSAALGLIKNTVSMKLIWGLN